jgi:5-formyltetrahydrofolate cyclo-ligase
MNLKQFKASIREKVWEKLGFHGLIPPFEGAGKAAERLRGLPEYKSAKRVMVPPDQAQLQVRINALMDGKELIMASPGLREGFFLVRKDMIKVPLWPKALRGSNIAFYGKPLSLKEIGEIDLLITGAVAVGLNGGRLGKGKGYFDLEYQILREIGAVKEDVPIVAHVDDSQVFDEVPLEEGDVSVNVIVTPTRVLRVNGPLWRPQGIKWDRIPSKLIKRMKLLWELSRSSKPEGQGEKAS